MVIMVLLLRFKFVMYIDRQIESDKNSGHEHKGSTAITMPKAISSDPLGRSMTK